MAKRVNHGFLFISAFIVSAIVGPSDVHVMSIMAVSMFLVAEIGLLFAKFFLEE